MMINDREKPYRPIFRSKFRYVESFSEMCIIRWWNFRHSGWQKWYLTPDSLPKLSSFCLLLVNNVWYQKWIMNIRPFQAIYSWWSVTVISLIGRFSQVYLNILSLRKCNYIHSKMQLYALRMPKIVSQSGLTSAIKQFLSSPVWYQNMIILCLPHTGIQYETSCM